ncbi:amino acid ABC transporter permease [Arthrobacter sp. ov118]|uniref:amino acid ABC transporter permease n=1 Tax=Arthrobacter sp. ov118 TaxID=1761747 RepID=UPI0008E31DCA|nr:amino acid ABC transporter permease [Arthrobacter sp. ov118]SFU11322.1 amino acid ABC transporter membrane protein, PAAT family [Arthrobacter sp. ov118]
MTGSRTVPVASKRRTPTEVVKLKRWGRVIGGAAAAALVVVIIMMFATSRNVDWPVVFDYIGNAAILSGVVVTVELTVLAMVLGTVLGTVIAIMRLSQNPVLRWISSTYVWFVRSIPQLVQILFWYNIALFVPTLGLGPWLTPTNAVITPIVAATLGLGLNEAAYMSEVVRAGILSIDKGQREAAASLGYRPAQLMRHIVLPQAMRVIIPPSSNEVIGMLKATSLVSVIGAADLLTRAQSISSSNFKIIELLFVASLWYIVATTVASIGQHYLEKKYSWSSRPMRRSSRPVVEEQV